jgi:hypothetical protein
LNLPVQEPLDDRERLVDIFGEDLLSASEDVARQLDEEAIVNAVNRD